MTIRNDFVSLWDNGTDKLCLFAISPEYQYEYIIGKPCITVGIAYENKRFWLSVLISKIQDIG